MEKMSRSGFLHGEWMKPTRIPETALTIPQFYQDIFVSRGVTKELEVNQLPSHVVADIVLQGVDGTEITVRVTNGDAPVSNTRGEEPIQSAHTLEEQHSFENGADTQPVVPYEQKASLHVPAGHESPFRSVLSAMSRRLFLQTSTIAAVGAVAMDKTRPLTSLMKRQEAGPAIQTDEDFVKAANLLNVTALTTLIPTDGRTVKKITLNSHNLCTQAEVEKINYRDPQNPKTPFFPNDNNPAGFYENYVRQFQGKPDFDQAMAMHALALNFQEALVARFTNVANAVDAKTTSESQVRADLFALFSHISTPIELVVDGPIPFTTKKRNDFAYFYPPFSAAVSALRVMKLTNDLPKDHPAYPEFIRVLRLPAYSYAEHLMRIAGNLSAVPKPAEGEPSINTYSYNHGGVQLDVYTNGAMGGFIVNVERKSSQSSEVF